MAIVLNHLRKSPEVNGYNSLISTCSLVDLKEVKEDLPASAFRSLCGKELTEESRFLRSASIAEV